MTTRLARLELIASILREAPATAAMLAARCPAFTANTPVVPTASVRRLINTYQGPAYPITSKRVPGVRTPVYAWTPEAFVSLN